MSNIISSLGADQHSPANSNYTNSTAVAAAWLVVYAFMVGGGLMIKPTVKQTAGVVAKAVDVREHQ